ncbi:MAG: glycosyltransferase N-terminal domain-containing protein [Bacteroidota bacterium]|nr:glycosyltransferase N-terminal domain-containing protein [Bacteroidota bacterium]
MVTLYSISIYCYSFLISIVGLFNKKARLWIKGRENWEANLLDKIGKGDSWIWFHCSSLGEFEDCCEVFFKIQKEYSTRKTILTVFSPSAFEVLSTSNFFDVITYLPLDTKKNAIKFINIVKPKLILFSRSELWLNFLLEAKKKGSSLFLVSLKLSKESYFIKWPFKTIYKKCFRCFTHIFCQNSDTQKLVNSSLNITNTSITGNTRFERIFKQSQIDGTFHEIEKFAQNSLLVVIGSSLPKDEKIFLKIYNELKFLNIKWIIVPHEIEKTIIIKEINPYNLILYSSISKLNKGQDVLIIDKVGILKHIYKYAKLALIGGGFDKIGIHNILEPSVFGVQTAFGPNYRNYEEANDLIKIGGATIYRNSEELKDLIVNKLTNPINNEFQKKIKQYVKHNANNSSQIVDIIKLKHND